MNWNRQICMTRNGDAEKKISKKTALHEVRENGAHLIMVFLAAEEREIWEISWRTKIHWSLESTLVQ